MNVAQVNTFLDAQDRERGRKPRPRWAPPEPPKPPGPFVVLHENRPVMSVPLHGEHGEGKRFLCDLLMWDRVKLLVGDEWMLRDDGGGEMSVVSGRKVACAFAGDRDGTTRTLRLARFITGAQPDQVVTYQDGNPLNLTKRNLVLEDRQEHWDRHRIVPYVDSGSPTGV